MAQCTSCSRTLTFLENVLNLFAKTNRCDVCNTKFNAMVTQWRQEITNYFNAGGVSAQIEQEYYTRLSTEQVPRDIGEPLVHMIKYLRNLSEIQWGNLPRIRTTIHLDSDEVVHFEWEAIYYKPTKTEKVIDGRIIATNKKMRFLSDEGNQGITIDWNNISEVQRTTRAAYRNGQVVSDDVIRLVLSRGTGGGLYWVKDCWKAKVAIDTMVRLWKRQLIIYKEQATTGAIPDHIKAAVFHRDGGKCRQCGYEGPYIEYYERCLGI